jgi:arylsulfatase A-like enzyme
MDCGLNIMTSNETRIPRRGRRGSIFEMTGSIGRPFGIWILALTFLGAFPLLSSARAAPGSRPNLIFILTDDQRWDSLGLTGNPVVKTPNIDRLAAEGTYFVNATVNSAICTPSRACYFLGQYERKHGVNFNSGTAVSAAAWRKSYPVLLREAGYFTGYIGKNHVPVGPRGYESGIIEPSFDFWYAGHGMLSFYPKRRHPIFKDAKAETQVEVLAEGATSFLDPRRGFIAGAQAFLERRPVEKPFCLTIAFNLPHNAGTSSMEFRPSDPELYRTTYRDQLETQPIPRTYVAQSEIRRPKLPPEVLATKYRQKSYDYVNTEASVRERQIREYQTITGIDQLVGAIRAELARIGAAGNTVIIYASDHGITHGEFGLGGKALNYDSCLRVPVIVMDSRAPAATRGRRSPMLAQSIDIAPTLLELASVPAPAGMQGQSLRPDIEGKPFNGRRYAFSENLWSTYYGNPRCESVRSAEWKYIRYFATDRSIFTGAAGEAEGGNVSDALAAKYADWLTASIRGEKPVYEELYHLSVDPDEVTNLAGEPKHAAVLNELRAECQRLVSEAKGDVAAAPDTVRIQPARNTKKARK